MTLLWIAGLAAVLAGGVGVVYTLILAVIPRGKPGTGPESESRIAVLIPAHNEEHVLGNLLGDLERQTRAPVLVAVVLDHCTDGTETVVRGSAAEPIVMPGDERGKARALARGIAGIQDKDWDAVLVVDADCRLSPDFLASAAPGRKEVVQSRVSLVTPAGSPPAIYEFLSRLENDWLHGGRERLGLPGFLRGTGMFLGRDALDHCPWRTESLTEDREQGFRFLRSGVPVRHHPGIAVETAPPSGVADSWSQRRRWTSVGIPAHLVRAARTAGASFGAFGVRVWELPLAVLADARSQSLFLVLAGTVLMVVGGRGWWPGAAILALTAVFGGTAGLRWYRGRFLVMLAQIPQGAVVAMAGAALSLIGRRPGGWGSRARN